MSVPFLDARLDQCRFPVAGERLSLLVCGNPVSVAGKPYCAACHALAYQPAREARPVRCEYVRAVKVVEDRTPDAFEAMS